MWAISHQSYFIGIENGKSAFAFFKILMAPKTERSDAFKDNIAKRLIPIVIHYLNPLKNKLNIQCHPTVEIGTLLKHYFWIEE